MEGDGEEDDEGELFMPVAGSDLISPCGNDLAVWRVCGLCCAVISQHGRRVVVLLRRCRVVLSRRVVVVGWTLRTWLDDGKVAAIVCRHCSQLLGAFVGFRLS